MIQSLPEPKRLVLAWQSSRDGSSRRRWDVGELIRASIDPYAPATFRYFDDATLAGAVAEGFEGYPAFRPKHGPFPDALETFMRRLPPRRRADFPRYLENLRIAPEATFTDFALLAASEAKLPSDGFSLVNPMDEHDGAMQFVTEAVGYRHVIDRPLPSPGDRVELAFDPTNAQDPNAIAYWVEGRLAGWVNRLQTAAFRRWIADDRIDAAVDRVNGTVDCPRLYLIVSVRG